MNKLSTAKRKAVVSALVEGASINSTIRMTGVNKVTVLKLLGCACAAYHNDRVRGLKLRSVQCDEVWSFNFCKAKNVAKTKLRDISYGDVWTWTALDPDSKMMISYLVGTRSPGDAHALMDDLAGRVIDIGTLTTDGYKAYPDAVQAAFGLEVPYAQLIKKYDSPDPQRIATHPDRASAAIRKASSASLMLTISARRTSSGAI